MRNFLIYLLLIFVFLFFISSCSGETYKKDETSVFVETPVKSVYVEEKTLPDPCKNINCKDNEVCSNGSCICSPASKLCKGSCIPSNNCCTSLDCSAREDCKDNKCTKSSFCGYNQQWDEAKKSCVCDEGTKFCSEQGKCIKYYSCCEETDCNSEGSIIRRCKKTVFIPHVCVKLSQGEHCISVAEGYRESFNILGDFGDIYVKNVYENGIVDLKIVHKSDDIEIDKLPLDEEKDFGRLSAKITEVEVKGGNCRENKFVKEE